MEHSVEHLKFSNRYTYPKLHSYEGLIGKVPLAGGSFYLGLEVETENIKTGVSTYIPGSFKAVEDGSLKVYGVEFVTVPIRFKYIEMELHRLFGAIPNAQFTPRTSIHVHMNARDFTDAELVKFLLLYLIFERNLYSFSGDRWNNNFCIPLHMAPSMVAQVLRRAHVNALGGIDWCKYHGLNLLPLVGEPGSSDRIGTIEFRQMAGTNVIQYILDWCNLIVSMKLAAKKLKTSDIVEAIVQNKTVTHEFIHSVFHQWTHLVAAPNGGLDAGIKMIEESTLGTKCIVYSSGLLHNIKG